MTNSTFGRSPNHRTHAESIGVENCSGGLTIFPGHAGWPRAEPQTNSPILNPPIDVGEFDVGEDSAIFYWFLQFFFLIIYLTFFLICPAPQIFCILKLNDLIPQIMVFWIMNEFLLICDFMGANYWLIIFFIKSKINLWQKSVFCCRELFEIGKDWPWTLDLRSLHYIIWIRHRIWISSNTHLNFGIREGANK